MHYLTFFLAATVFVIATGGNQALFVKSYEAVRAGDVAEAVSQFSTALKRTVQESDPSLDIRAAVATERPQVVRP